MTLNEAKTCAELIAPKLKEAGWGVDEGTRIRRQYPVSTTDIPSSDRSEIKN